MSTIKNVAIVGASGTLGTAITSVLLSHSFTVTALTRSSSTSTFPPSIRALRTDTTSLASLTTALTGQDAVISCITTSAVSSQKLLIDATVAAGVKRFMPSEFGLDTQDAEGTKAGVVMGVKREVVKYLREKAEGNEGFTWTSMSTGSFFDWSLRLGVMGFNVQNRTARIYDSGDEPYSVTNLPMIGRCVAAVLQHPEETANKYITVASFTTTQNEVLRVLEEETGHKFEVTHASTAEMEKLEDEKWARGDGGAFYNYALKYIYGDGGGHAIRDNAVHLLGLQEEDLRDTVKRVLREISSI